MKLQNWQKVILTLLITVLAVGWSGTTIYAGATLPDYFILFDEAVTLGNTTFVGGHTTSPQGETPTLTFTYVDNSKSQPATIILDDSTISWFTTSDGKQGWSGSLPIGFVEGQDELRVKATFADGTDRMAHFDDSDGDPDCTGSTCE